MKTDSVAASDNVVGVEWLAERLGQPGIFVADCRFELADPQAGQRAYDQAHIPGAVFFDLDRDLSRSAGGNSKVVSAEAPHGTGGRHPLPSIHNMAARFGEAGIGDGVMVVCYDDQRGAMAARLWWMLRYLGHQQVALLDGGYTAWRAAGYPATSDPAQLRPRTFVPRLQQHMLATMDDVRHISATGQGIIIDSRTPERYRGDVEPLDPVAGHIPGAINMPWEGNLHRTGLIFDADTLAQRFARVRGQADGAAPDIHNDPSIIVHCGSGVTGCLNVLAMERAGITEVKLYVGGWSDWCSHPHNPVATGPD